ncbi:MAG: hypothetical protein ACFFDN_02650 [Candidatus Hodarchaeota archaeon]
MLEKTKSADLSTQGRVDLLNKRSRTKLEFCISSKCEDGLHILFWDFDMIEKHFVLRSLSQVQNFHQLGNIYVIKSRHGFNAFCLDKLFLNEAYNVLFYSRWNDFNHVRIGFKSESWALKLSQDKKIILRLAPTDNGIEREQSNAHYQFFKKFFNFKGLEINKKKDIYDDIQLESYEQHKV